MKHLRGYTKRYFSLAIISMYSTLNKLATLWTNYKYHLKAVEYQEYKTSPPLQRHFTEN
ncbi:hypothetical protein [Candidatus Marinarcus aquaticus]|uniref:hypothetical protein n=1 Tax=Candidatus Marinarcus aquaticus TaxID=2044504 RepID=UPI0013E8FCAF|nr:hypothetical protein [Candidatus Marinarcus aquaticus]